MGMINIVKPLMPPGFITPPMEVFHAVLAVSVISVYVKACWTPPGTITRGELSPIPHSFKTAVLTENVVRYSELGAAGRNTRLGAK